MCLHAVFYDITRLFYYLANGLQFLNIQAKQNDNKQKKEPFARMTLFIKVCKVCV